MIPTLSEALADAAIGMKRIHFTPGEEMAYQKCYVEDGYLAIHDDRERPHSGFRMNIRTLTFNELAKVRFQTKMFKPTFEPVTHSAGIRPIAIQINDSSVMNDHWEASLIFRCALNLEQRYLMDCNLYYMSRRIQTNNTSIRVEWSASNHHCVITEFPLDEPSDRGKPKHTFRNVNREFFETIGEKIQRLHTWL